jgi:integrase
MTAHLQLIRPSNENRSVRTRHRIPTRPSNRDLTPSEVQTLISAARKGRYGHRDATLILVAIGMDCGPLRSAIWNGPRSNLTARPPYTFGGSRTASRRRIRSRELQRKTKGGFVFETERGGPFTPDAVNRRSKRIGERAGFDYPVHAHMLRHACGYALANAGHDTRAIQDWLGHRSIQHTVPYTDLTPTRFRDFWR